MNIRIIILGIVVAMMIFSIIVIGYGLYGMVAGSSFEVISTCLVVGMISSFATMIICKISNKQEK